MRKIILVVSLIIWSCFVLIFPAALIFINEYFALPQYELPAGNFLGLLMILVAFAITLYAVISFLTVGRGTPVPVDPPRKLVITGLYKYTRNPIYLAYFLLFLGYFLAFGTVLLLGYFLSCTIFFYFYVVYHEEPVLKKRFGQEYEDYLRKVPRWFPKI